jgi:hypothetical protein
MPGLEWRDRTHTVRVHNRQIPQTPRFSLDITPDIGLVLLERVPQLLQLIIIPVNAYVDLAKLYIVLNVREASAFVSEKNCQLKLHWK